MRDVETGWKALFTEFVSEPILVMCCSFCFSVFSSVLSFTLSYLDFSVSSQALLLTGHYLTRLFSLGAASLEPDNPESDQPGPGDNLHSYPATTFAYISAMHICVIFPHRGLNQNIQAPRALLSLASIELEQTIIKIQR